MNSKILDRFPTVGSFSDEHYSVLAMEHSSDPFAEQRMIIYAQNLNLLPSIHRSVALLSSEPSCNPTTFSVELLG